jgi:hypothetical protein
LAPGKYELSAEASDYEPFRDAVTVQPGETASVTVRLIRISKGVDFFQNPAQLAQQGEWFQLQKGASIAYLKPGLLRMHFTFQKNKVQWVVESADGKRQIRYELDKQKLKRELRQQHGSVDHQEHNADARSSAPSASISVHIQVEGSRVKITNDRGEVLDDCTSPESDFSNGRLGIKTDSLFTVQKD